jgi:hypothetical protein
LELSCSPTTGSQIQKSVSPPVRDSTGAEVNCPTTNALTGSSLGLVNVGRSDDLPAGEPDDAFRLAASSSLWVAVRTIEAPCVSPHSAATTSSA